MICLVFLMIRYVIFWVGAKEELPPEVLRMDGETVRVTGQIYKREQREKRSDMVSPFRRQRLHCLQLHMERL